MRLMETGENKPAIIGTGLTGLVGSRLVELLSAQYAFTNLDLATGIDITNETLVNESLEKNQGDVVIHTAAFTDVNSANAQKGFTEGLCYQLNVKATGYLARACAARNKYLIHISTDFVFDGENPPPGGYTEAEAVNPIEWYGQTKAWAEEEVREAGGRSAIVRIAFPFRARYELKKDLVNSIIDKLASKIPLSMFSDQIITPTFIDDIAKAVGIFIEKKPQGIYHLVGSASASPFQIALKVAEVFGYDRSLVRESSLAEFLKTASRPYQKNLTVSNLKAKTELGIQMLGVNEALQELKKQLS